MDTASKNQFGPWNVRETMRGTGRTCYLVQKNGGGLHVLKPAIPDKPIDEEVQVLKRLIDHPNIITLVDYDLQAQTPWHVTKYCSGGMLSNNTFQKWSLEELNHRQIMDKLLALGKAFGYAHSQGILLGIGTEVFLTDKKDLVLGDIEAARIWKNHHIDTTNDLKEYSKVYSTVLDNAKQARLNKLTEKRKKKQMQQCHANAQPSAPLRLDLNNPAMNPDFVSTEK